jgi:hypothetical protein
VRGRQRPALALDSDQRAPHGPYGTTLTGAGEDNNATGDLDIKHNVIIAGAGAGSTIIDGNASDRALHIFSGVTAGIQNITITNAVLTTATISHMTGDSGGGIYSPVESKAEMIELPDGRKVMGTIHWLSAAHAIGAEVRLYDHLFTKSNPGDIEEGADYRTYLNPASCEKLSGCFVEPGMAGASPGARFQFERLGYFCVDPDSTRGRLVFNRSVALRDTWGKIEKAQQ